MHAVDKIKKNVSLPGEERGCYMIYKIEIYGIAAIHVDIWSLQYVVNRCFSEIFQTRSDDVIAECIDNAQLLAYTVYLPVADAMSNRSNFLLKFGQSDNFLCQICCSVVNGDRLCRVRSA